MTEEEFISSRDKLIADIRSSSLYCEFKKLDKEIYEDKNIIALNKEKDKLNQSYKFADEKTKDLILASVLKIQKQIDDLPLVKKYYEIRKQLKKLVEPLNQEIIDKIYF